MRVADAEEAGFSHVAQFGDPACGGHLLLIGKVREQIGGRNRGLKACSERIDTQLPEFGEFSTADGDQFGFGGLGLGGGVAHTGSAVGDNRKRSKHIVMTVAGWLILSKI